MKTEKQIIDMAKNLETRIAKTRASLKFQQEQRFSDAMVAETRANLHRLYSQMNSLIWVLDY